MAVSYKALEPKKYAKKILSETKETKYWKRFEKVYDSTEKASVNLIACENERNYFAMASGDIIQIYDSNKQKIKGKIEKFKSGAVTGVAFRQDGKLIAAGETNGRFHIIETKKRSILRTFRQHKEAVHAVRFLANSAYIASGSDDLTLKFFDISTNSMVRNFVGLHNDFIRSIRVFSENEKLLLVGSYDKTVSLVDLRILDQKAVQTFTHEDPVEDLDIFADDNRFVSVAGTTTTIWDVRQSRSIGSSVHNLKTLTAVKVSSQGQRIITSSLDQHLKVLDPENFTVHYQAKYPSSIMSFNITKNETFMAIGLNTGEFEVKCRRRTDEEAKAIEEEDRNDIPLPQLEGKSKRVIRNFRFFYRGIYETPTAYDHQLETQKKQKLQAFDRYLKKFQYKRALDAALKMNNANITIGLIEELVQRDAVDIALRNGSQEELDKLFEFLLYNLQDPKFSTILVPIAEKVLDIYGGQVLEDTYLKNKFQGLSDLLERILQEKDLMMNLLGKLELILDSNILQNE